MPLRFFIAAVGASFSLSVHSADWPQFLGPGRNLISPETNLNVEWPAEGPKVLWRQKTGEGFSGPVVVGDRLVLFDREGGSERITCRNAETGDPLWEYTYRTEYEDRFGFDEGPRSTPTINGDHVYTFGAEGTLSCVKLSDGELVWSVRTLAEYGADLGFFGLVCSPLVTEELVLMHIGGGDDKGIMAFDKRDGSVRWSATDDEAGYSSPIRAAMHDREYAFFFTREGLVAVDPSNGHQYFEFPWKSRMNASVNSATPVVMGNRVFLSASYQTGAVILEIAPNAVRPVWQGNDKLSNHYATSVFTRGMLAGFHGRADIPPGAELRCIDANTGRVLWQNDAISNGTILLADNHWYVLTEKGEFYVAPVSSRGFKPASYTQLMGGTVRAYPALANGRFYARNDRELVCVDLRKN